MAFIAIHSKADIATADITTGDVLKNPALTTKKGKLSPQQAAILNYFSFERETGVLDIGSKCALQDNISNIISGKVEFTFLGGYFVICGRLIECQSGTTYSFDADTVNTNDIIVAELNKSGAKGNEFAIKIIPSTSTLLQQNLLFDGTIYQLPMYRIIKESTRITLDRHNEFSVFIPTTGTALAKIKEEIKEEILGTGTTTTGVPPLQGYNKAKGTVEERLAQLGFKSGAITFGGTSYSPNAQTAATATQGLFRQGNYVVGKLILTNNSRTGSPIDISIGTIPENFRPIKNERITVFATMGTNFDPTYGSSSATSVAFMTINANGIVTRISVIADAGIPFAGTYRSWLISFGYEAPPIN